MIEILLEERIAFHCAPALAGIKPGNLVSFCNYKNPNLQKYILYLNHQLNKNDIYFETMCNCSKRTLVFAYRKKQLSQWIYQNNHVEYLKKVGYPTDFGFDAVISYMKNRIQSHHEFPHEIGVFLGYPLSDIKGFVKNKGANFKVNGYWKVYDNQEQTIKLFESFTRCRKTLLNHVYTGKTIVGMFGKSTLAG